MNRWIYWPIIVNCCFHACLYCSIVSYDFCVCQCQCSDRDILLHVIRLIPSNNRVLYDFWVCQCQWSARDISVHTIHLIPFNNIVSYDFWVCQCQCSLTETLPCISNTYANILFHCIQFTQYVCLSLSMDVWLITTYASQTSGFVTVSGQTETWSHTLITLCTLRT